MTIEELFSSLLHYHSAFPSAAGKESKQATVYVVHAGVLHKKIIPPKKTEK